MVSKCHTLNNIKGCGRVASVRLRARCGGIWYYARCNADLLSQGKSGEMSGQVETQDFCVEKKVSYLLKEEEQQKIQTEPRE